MTKVIAVDARMVRSSGIGVYTRNILRDLIRIKPEWTFRLFGDPLVLAEIFPQPNTEIVPFRSAIYTIAEQRAFPRLLQRDIDALWVPHYNIPIFAPVPLFVTVHDIAHLAEPSVRGGPLRRFYAHTLFSAVRRKAAQIFFVSEFSHSEFSRIIGPPKCPWNITYNAAAPVWRAAAKRAPGPRPLARDYLVFVGNVKPHKNLSRLLMACKDICQQRDIDLVLIGRKDNFLTGAPEVSALAGRMPEHVRFTGEVSDAELIEWVRHARAMVFPSLYEGFGIPPLEAMTVGCPTIVSRIPPLLESCGTASEFVDPYSVDDIRRGILRVLTDPDYAEALRQKGAAQIRKFDFAASAQIISDAMTTYFRTSEVRRG